MDFLKIERLLKSITSSGSSLSSFANKGRSYRFIMQMAAEKCSAPVNVSDSQLFSFLENVNEKKLNETEKLIHKKHVDALQKRLDTYKDPSTGYTVITRLQHLKRGSCCGNACRHCPFNHKAVAADKPIKTFNTAFYS
ncbi:unnamed protein product [Lymnaea stagnalis]|uniref:Uncharacterized protein n=1 Tax=Lymnaea stagnalis TaxID=6523 RepID=A0AAV2IFU6_LYMST